MPVQKMITFVVFLTINQFTRGRIIKIKNSHEDSKTQRKDYFYLFFFLRAFMFSWHKKRFGIRIANTVRRRT